MLIPGKNSVGGGAYVAVEDLLPGIADGTISNASELGNLARPYSTRVERDAGKAGAAATVKFSA